MLSVLWGGIAVFACYRWLRAENLPANLCLYVCTLLVVNPFFWQYATYIRFYSFFLATTLILLWRAGRLSATGSRADLRWYILAILLAATAHLFSLLSIFASIIVVLRKRYPWAVRLLGAAAVVFPAGLLLSPALLRIVVLAVERVTGVAGPGPADHVRGLSPAMLAKIPLTLFFFAAGEHLYPLSWALTAPILAIVALCAIRGIFDLRNHRTLALWVFLLASLAVEVFVVFDPLAPPGLQGAGPRYVIFAFPVFWAVMALGSFQIPTLRISLILVNLMAFSSLLFSTWSYSQFDLMDWPKYFRQYTQDANHVCIVADGRSEDPVERYAPRNALVTATATDCTPSFDRILVVTNDYREEILRPFDRMVSELYRESEFLGNTAVFPAQITAFQRSFPATRSGLPVSRLTLPEEDLRLPLPLSAGGQALPGFIRLDRNQPALALTAPSARPAYVLSNFRAAREVPDGAPVLQLRFAGPGGAISETVLRSGMETAGWRGTCRSCAAAARWQKKIALLGRAAYDDAYRQYDASVWAYPISDFPWPYSTLEVTSLLDSGTVYFWGLSGMNPDLRRSR